MCVGGGGGHVNTKRWAPRPKKTHPSKTSPRQIGALRNEQQITVQFAGCSCFIVQSDLDTEVYRLKGVIKLKEEVIQQLEVTCCCGLLPTFVVLC